MNPFESYKNGNLFVITCEDHKLVIAGYPIWRAFVCAEDSDFWIEIIPTINATTKTIDLPKVKKKKKLQQKHLPKCGLLSEEKNEKEIDPELLIQFFASVPSEILQLVSIFPDSHWGLINAAKSIGEDFKSLMRTNPALAYLIVNIEKFNPSFICYPSVDILQTMIRTKRKDILRLCGFPESVSIVKILAKIDLGALDAKLLVKLKDLLAHRSEQTDRIIQLLTFSKRINKHLIHLVSVNHTLLPILSDKIIFELINVNEYFEISSSLMKMQLDSVKWKVRMPTINSLLIVDRVKKKFDEEVKRKRDNLENFPPPPFEDNDFVKAITKEKELISWSKRQKNCIRNFANVIRKDESYFYKVFNNFEEATLEVKKIRGVFRLGNLLGVNNCKVSPELVGIVNKWFKESKGN